MKGFKDVFARIELKYLMTDEQYVALRKRLEPIAKVDEYGETQILNIYFDTPRYNLIRTSSEKPYYKEKLRFRCYGTPEDDTLSFVEIKKKSGGIVYKRRIGLPYKEGVANLYDGKPFRENSMITKEIEVFMDRYKELEPAMAISYKRTALAGIEDPGLRITFDRDLRWRTTDLYLTYGDKGHKILEDGMHLMEVKVDKAVPYELARIFNELGIYKTSISKYGRAFQQVCAGKEE